METKSINWTHHRNGVAGHPLHCAIVDGVLLVEFREYDINEEIVLAQGVTARLDEVRTAVEAATPGKWEGAKAGRSYRADGRRQLVTTGDGWVVFNLHHQGDHQRQMLAVTTGDEGCMTAVFDLDMLAEGNVTFGENSWRGDHYHNDVRRWLG